MPEPREFRLSLSTLGLPAWAQELAALAAAIALVLVSGIGAAFLSDWAELLLIIFALFWLVTCLGAFARPDPLGYLSIAVPLLVLLVLVVVVPLASLPFVFIALAWIAIWTVLGTRIWPAWSLTVLRRMRPGSAEFEVHAADVRIYKAWSNLPEVFRELNELWHLETPTTLPVTNGIYAMWDATIDPRHDRAALARVGARLREERDRLWIQPVPRVLSWNDAAGARPSRSTRLEYRFPRLEALVALGSREELARMVSATAEHATQVAGVWTPELGAALARAARGDPQSGPLEEVRTRLEELRARRRLALEAASEPGNYSRRLFEQVSALSSAEYALDVEDQSAASVADAIYEAIHTTDPDDPEAYEAILTAILGPVRSEQAIEVQPKSRRGEPGGNATADRGLGPFWSAIAAASGTRRSLIGLVAVGLLAGALGTVIRQGFRIFDWDFGDVDRTIGVLAIALVSYLLLRRSMGRSQGFDLLVLLIISMIAQALFNPAYDLSRALLFPLIPQAWSDVFDNATTALPFVPWHAGLYAVALVATAYGLQHLGVDTAAGPRSREGSSAQT